MTTPWLRTLDKIEGSDLPLVGGKAFNLATLRRHSLPVPPGLVVTTAFFEAQLRHHQFIPLWAGSPDVAVTEDALCWLADTLKTIPLAPELMEALKTQLDETFPGVESFAVRSSAIDEDSRHYAFSGIHLSELAVPRQMVPVSLGRCWASALSKPALEYRRRHGIRVARRRTDNGCNGSAVAHDCDASILTRVGPRELDVPGIISSGTAQVGWRGNGVVDRAAGRS